MYAASAFLLFAERILECCYSARITFKEKFYWIVCTAKICLGELIIHTVFSLKSYWFDLVERYKLEAYAQFKKIKTKSFTSFTSFLITH